MGKVPICHVSVCAVKVMTSCFADSRELRLVSEGAVGVAFPIPERRGASRVRAQRPEKAGPQNEPLFAGCGGDGADEATELTDSLVFCGAPWSVVGRLVLIPQGSGTLRGF